MSWTGCARPGITQARVTSWKATAGARIRNIEGCQPSRWSPWMSRPPGHARARAPFAARPARPVARLGAGRPPYRLVTDRRGRDDHAAPCRARALADPRPPASRDGRANGAGPASVARGEGAWPRRRRSSTASASDRPRRRSPHMRARLKADLVVMGRGAGRPVRDAFLGSTAERVIRQARTPILVIRSPARARYRRPALGLDVDGAAEPVLAMLSRVIPPPRPRVTIVHAHDGPYLGMFYAGLPGDRARRAGASTATDQRPRRSRRSSRARCARSSGSRTTCPPSRPTFATGTLAA